MGIVRQATCQECLPSFHSVLGVPCKGYYQPTGLLGGSSSDIRIINEVTRFAKRSSQPFSHQLVCMKLSSPQVNFQKREKKVDNHLENDDISWISYMKLQQFTLKNFLKLLAFHVLSIGCLLSVSNLWVPFPKSSLALTKSFQFYATFPSLHETLMLLASRTPGHRG